MCAQIEQNPRQGVELYGTCGAPDSLVSALEFAICNWVTLAVIGLGVWVVARFA